MGARSYSRRGACLTRRKHAEHFLSSRASTAAATALHIRVILWPAAVAASAACRPIAKQGAFQSELAKARIDTDAARLLVLTAAAALDQEGFKGAKGAIAIAKVQAPNAALRVIDLAVQVHGGGGVSQDFMLARLWTHARTLRIADGPDEVHLGTIAKMELAKHMPPRSRL